MSNKKKVENGVWLAKSKARTYVFTFFAETGLTDSGLIFKFVPYYILKFVPFPLIQITT